MIIAQALRLIVLQSLSSASRLKWTTDGMLAFASHHWQQGPLLTNERTPWPGIDQSEATSTSPISHTLPIDQFDVQMLCWDGSDLPGSDPHQDTDPCHASRAGETLTLLSLSKQIISQVLSWEFVFSHTFTRLRYIESLLVETFQSLSLFLDQHSSLYVTFNLMLLG